MYLVLCYSELLRTKKKLSSTVEPRLTNTLLRRTPHLDEQFWPVPNIFSVKSCLKTPLWANNLALPVERTAVCPPKVSVCEVFTLNMAKNCSFHPSQSPILLWLQNNSSYMLRLVTLTLVMPDWFLILQTSQDIDRPGVADICLISCKIAEVSYTRGMILFERPLAFNFTR